MAKEIIIRCTTCGRYWRVPKLPDIPYEKSMFQCPAQHFAAYEIERDLIVDAPLIPEDKLIFLTTESKWVDELLAAELEFVKAQTVELYDCGFFQLLLQPQHQPLPPIDLMKMKRPDIRNTLEDEDGKMYRLVISPNGVTYYRRCSQAEEEMINSEKS